jgi:hypothetical protein
MGQRSSVYLADDLAAAVKASGVPLAELIHRGLATGTAEVAQSATPAPAGTPSLTALPGGEPDNGAISTTPGCFQRDTRRYGLRKPPLCPACAAALRSEVYQREISPTAARLTRRGAARPPRK